MTRPSRIERRGNDRDDAGERDIGRGDAQIVGRQGVTLAVESPARAGAITARREQEPDDRERDDGERHGAEHAR